MTVLQKEIITSQNIVVKETDLKIYRLKNIFTVIRPYLRDLINEHRPIMELNNNNNDDNNNKNKNNFEKSYTQKKARHEPSGWAMFTRCSFDKKENKINYYRGKDYIEKLCKKLKERAMKIINYEEKEMIPLTYEENKSYKEQEACHICEEKFCMDKDDENYKNKRKVKDHCHYTGKFRGAAHSKCNLNYKVPKDIPIIIHNASYDIHFIINQLAEEFKGELNCIGENMEKYITFSVPIKKKCDDSKTITYKLRFIDSFRFMPTSLLELVDNMSGNFNSIECKSCTENNRCEECKKLMEGLIKKFSCMYQFCKGDLNKFVLLLRKGVYPHECMNSCEKIYGKSLRPKEDFYSELNLEGASD